MADLRIVDAPLLSTVKGTEKIPTGGEGNFSISVDQVVDFAKLKWFLATEGYVDNAVGNVQDDLNLHKNNSSNPHQVTKVQVGLGNVDNTADLDKPIGSATQAALTTLTQTKADKTYVDSQLNNKADKATTYTKTETESLVSAKSDITYVNTKYSSHIKTFLNTGTALSNTVNGEYFFVISNDSEKVEDLYLNVNGVATNQNKSELSSLLQHNSILGRDVTGAHQATSISTESGVNQQQINDFGGAKWYSKSGGYELGATVKLANGDIVKSTAPNNTKNPNVDMTGWVKSGNLVIINTVAELVAKNLKNGDAVKTLGYNNLSDNGGAIYLISSVATGYSIPLVNGLHAVLKDSFDIRKFGIVDDPTLDQSDELTRMSIYADLYSYEIDFLNFKLMTPKTVRDITYRNSEVRGLYFTKPHKLKNLYITHDKTQQLVQGHSCITFSFSDRFGIGEIAAENVTLDPYIEDHLLLNGEGDGYLFGIAVRWETAYLLTLGILHDVYLTDYEINFKNIRFLSTAVSYNLCSQIKTRNAYLENATGDHMVIFFVSNAYNTYLSNVHTVHRYDMRIASGRNLGAALLHYEPEITGSSVTYGDIVMENCSVRDSSGALGFVFYQHKIPNCSIKVENYTFKNCVGRIGNAAQANDGMSDIYEIMETLTIDNIHIENCNGGYDFYSYIKNMVIVDRDGYTPFEARIRHVDKFSVIGTLNMPFFFAYGDTRVGELNIDTLIVNDPAYGFINNLETVTIDHIKIKKVIVNSQRLIKCKFSTLSIDEMIIPDSITLLDAMISTNNQAIIELSNIKVSATIEGSLVAGNDISFVTISDSDINANLVANGILTVKRCTLRFRSLYVGRTVAANTQVALGGTFSKGIKLGQIADVSLDKPLGGTRLFAQVDMDGRVEAYQVNSSSLPVTIESGVLAFSVKAE